MSTVSEDSDISSKVAAQADVLDRIASVVMFFAVLVAAFSLFGGFFALTQDGVVGSGQEFNAGWVYICGGTLFGGVVAMLAVWAKTYAAVVIAREQAR